MNKPIAAKGNVGETVEAGRYCPNCDKVLRITYEYPTGMTHKRFVLMSNEKRYEKAVKITEWCWDCGYLLRIK